MSKFFSIIVVFEILIFNLTLQIYRRYTADTEKVRFR